MGGYARSWVDWAVFCSVSILVMYLLYMLHRKPLKVWTRNISSICSLSIVLSSQRFQILHSGQNLKFIATFLSAFCWQLWSMLVLYFWIDTGWWRQSNLSDNRLKKGYFKLRTSEAMTQSYSRTCTTPQPPLSPTLFPVFIVWWLSVGSVRSHVMLSVVQFPSITCYIT